MEKGDGEGKGVEEERGMEEEARGSVLSAWGRHRRTGAFSLHEGVLVA
jgi:hypothetical protein